MDDYGPAHTHEARKCRGMSSTLAGEEGAPAISQSQSLVQLTGFDTGVSENSVPLNPMVNDHYPY